MRFMTGALAQIATHKTINGRIRLGVPHVVRLLLKRIGTIGGRQGEIIFVHTVGEGVRRIQFDPYDRSGVEVDDGTPVAARVGLGEFFGGGCVGRDIDLTAFQ